MRRCAVGCCSVWDASQYGRFVAVINVDMACVATRGAVLLAFICTLSVLVLVNVLLLSISFCSSHR